MRCRAPYSPLLLSSRRRIRGATSADGQELAWIEKLRQLAVDPLYVTALARDVVREVLRRILACRILESRVK